MGKTVSIEKSKTLRSTKSNHIYRKLKTKDKIKKHKQYARKLGYMNKRYKQYDKIKHELKLDDIHALDLITSFGIETLYTNCCK